MGLAKGNANGSLKQNDPKASTVNRVFTNVQKQSNGERISFQQMVLKQIKKPDLNFKP